MPISREEIDFRLEDEILWGREKMILTRRDHVTQDTSISAPSIIEADHGTYDTRVSVSGVRELLARKDVEGLAGLLKEDDWQIRLVAVCGLGEIRDARIIVPLIRTLCDSDDRVSGEAKRVLRRILSSLPFQQGFFGWEQR